MNASTIAYPASGSSPATPSKGVGTATKLVTPVMSSVQDASDASGGVVVRVDVKHGEVLPQEYVSQIPASDQIILRFLLAFLRGESLSHVELFINGGYVRDLLLGKKPDDLDVSLCLRACPETTNVGDLLEQMKAFALATPALGIVEVKTATILSDETKNKMIDTAKAFFLDASGSKTEVDIMPTIGEEVYEEGSRIPVRDQRGTAQQDALRRDLTIGALLLRVEGDNGSLRFTILDFYGGLADIRYGVLRGPYPAEKSLEELRDLVLRLPEERQLAADLHLSELPVDQEKLVLWWAKILMEDPVRICRALRFAAKLKGFHLHEAFWHAVPFALPSLQSKVAGSRKNTEFVKIGGYGFDACFCFFQLVFTRTFQNSGGTQTCLASYLFGGVDSKGKSHVLPPIKAFDGRPDGAFSTLAGSFAPEVGSTLEPMELVGSLLAAAIYTAEFDGGEDAEQEFARACRGLSASNMMREAGASPLLGAARLLAANSATPAPSGIDHACGKIYSGATAEDLWFYGVVLEAFKVADGPTSKWPSAGEERPHRQRLALAMVRQADPLAADRAATCRKVLLRPRQAMKGQLLQVPGLVEVPNQLKGQVMKMMDIVLRLLKYDAPLEDERQLRQLLDAVPNFVDVLGVGVWYKEGPGGHTLKEEFQPRKERKTDSKSVKGK